MTATQPNTTHEQRDLADKVAIITSSSRGLGRGITHALAQTDANSIIINHKYQACMSSKDIGYVDQDGHPSSYSNQS